MKSHYNCIIIEDVALQRKNLTAMLGSRLDLKVIEEFENADEAYKYLCATEKVRPDIMFLDIQLAEFNGLDLLKAIRKLEQKPKVIITTAHPQYAIPSYDYNVSGYVLKPLEMDKLNQAIDKAIEQLKKKETYVSAEERTDARPFLAIKENNKIINIFHDEILYLEGANVNVKIITNIATHLPRETLRNMENQLPPSHFLRIHDSFIINLDYLRGYAKNFSSVDLLFPKKKDVHTIPIGKKYRQKIKNKLVP